MRLSSRFDVVWTSLTDHKINMMIIHEESRKMNVQKKLRKRKM